MAIEGKIIHKYTHRFVLDGTYRKILIVPCEKACKYLLLQDDVCVYVWLSDEKLLQYIDNRDKYSNRSSYNYDGRQDQQRML